MRSIRLIPHLGVGFALNMLSALILNKRGYPAMLLVEQLAHQRFIRGGPLVLSAAPLRNQTPIVDRDRTVLRRSEPSSRAVLMDEQSNPWELLHPQDTTHISSCHHECRLYHHPPKLYVKEGSGV